MKPWFTKFFNTVLALDILHVVNLEGHKMEISESIDMELMKNLGWDVKTSLHWKSYPVCKSLGVEIVNSVPVQKRYRCNYHKICCILSLSLKQVFLLRQCSPKFGGWNTHINGYYDMLKVANK